MTALGDDDVQNLKNILVFCGAYKLTSLLMHSIFEHALADGLAALSWEELAIWGLKDAFALGVFVWRLEVHKNALRQSDE
mmetsp:Transcript_682/g.1786  ORF Transcript_682/g.1786 Transcript_682/m.1786 type:complete len:80 (-) Transcript_682:192-431(-)